MSPGDAYLEGVRDGHEMALSWMRGRSRRDLSLRSVYEEMREFIDAVTVADAATDGDAVTPSELAP